MKILINEHHTPHAWSIASLFPEHTFTTVKWHSKFRPVLPNVVLETFPSCLDFEYDAVIEDDYAFQMKDVKAKKKIFMQHNEHDAGNVYLAGVLQRSLEWADHLVCVTDHKRATLREFAFHPKVKTIRLHVSGTEFPLRSSYINGRIGTVHNTMPEEVKMMAVETMFRFKDRVVIGWHNEDRVPLPLYNPKSFEDYKKSVSELHVFVHCLYGQQMGFSPMEAMAMGVPMITGNVPEPNIFGMNTWNCLLSRNEPGKSINWMRDGIQWLLDHPEEAEQIGKNGRDSILNYQPEDKCRKEWLEVLT